MGEYERYVQRFSAFSVMMMSVKVHKAHLRQVSIGVVQSCRTDMGYPHPPGFSVITGDASQYKIKLQVRNVIPEYRDLPTRARMLSRLIEISLENWQ